MNWFNYLGLVIIAVIMIPNIIYAVKHKNQAVAYNNKAAVIFEHIGRYGCFALMIFNIPYTYIGYWFSFGEAVYIAVNAALLTAYCISWGVLWNKNGIVKALLLSVIPSVIFIASGIIILNIPLFAFAVVFAAAHILISVKSARAENADEQKVKKKTALTVTSVLLSAALVFAGTMGGTLMARQNNLPNLEEMSAQDMIEYCCSDKDTKISVALIENGEVTYRIYGKDGKETNIYDYEIGSVSKTFVGALCAKAVSENKLNLSDSIAKYLNLDDGRYYPTVERLLTHTSGYAAYYFESSMIGNKFAHISNDLYGISKDKILKRVKSVALEDKDYPFVYSNFGISVLGLVLESVYNGGFTEIMNDFILNDLHLQNAQVAKQSGNLSKYLKWKDGDGYIPAGSIVSDIESMASYLQLYMNDTVSYLPATYAKLKDLNANQAASEALNIRVDGAGMTWMLDDKNGIVWHNGATSDFNSYTGFKKDKSKGVVILSNLNVNDKISMTVIGAKLLTGQFDL